jgi:DNA-binding response OmpR family regulator
LRVLIVDDDRRLVRSLSRSLVESGMAVDGLDDGEDALAGARSLDYDVIVLDVMLPRLSGLEVCRQLRSHHVETPILMLTGLDAVDDRVAGLEAGADDYLVKPFALKEVVARLRALSRRHLSQRTSLLTAGPIVMDTAAHTLTVNSQIVELTSKEFSILEYFLLNQGRLITRSQLIEHVWSFGFDGGRNLIEVYIARLRRKLGDAGAADPLTTLRGSGYRFVSPAV